MRIGPAVVFPLIALFAACGQSEPRIPAELDGRWDVQQIAGAALGQDVAIFVEFDAQGGAMTGFTGCNTFSAPVSAFSEVLAVGPITEGEGECPSEAHTTDEARLLAVLPHVQRFNRRGRSLELLQMAPGEALLLLRLSDGQPSQE